MKRYGPIAPKGAGESRFTLRMDKALRTRLESAARRVGLTSTEYVRQAVREKLSTPILLPVDPEAERRIDLLMAAQPQRGVKVRLRRK